MLLAAATASAAYTIDYEASLTSTAATGDFAPYYTSALGHGKITAPFNILAEAKAWRPIDLTKRFSYGFGADIIGGRSSATDYAVFRNNAWSSRSVRPQSVILQQLYAEVKYRGVFLTAGMKEHTSALLDNELTSGDLTESGNARPIPEVRIGFIDFQNIPLTNGWIQIQGEIAYGKMTDSNWWLDHYNYYNYHVNTGEWYNYKRCYFRTRPSERFSVTVGMQAAATFGGRRYEYSDGELKRDEQFPVKLKSFWNAFLPMQGSGEDFYEGNHLGSWDFLARYTLSGGDELKAYFQWPWEDGSGIGRRNGWDGLWGIEWRSADDSRPITGAVIEYIDMTNQSGPQHYAPADNPGNTIVSESTGADDYYNNVFYNSYANYGLSIGTPMIMAPLYNLDGYPAYTANRMRGIHIAARGNVMPGLKWRARMAHRTGYGSGRLILPHDIHLTSMAFDMRLDIPGAQGLNLAGTVALDMGTMPGSSFGAMVTLSYSGLLKL